MSKSWFSSFPRRRKEARVYFTAAYAWYIYRCSAIFFVAQFLGCGPKGSIFVPLQLQNCPVLLLTSEGKKVAHILSLSGCKEQLPSINSDSMKSYGLYPARLNSLDLTLSIQFRSWDAQIAFWLRIEKENKTNVHLMTTWYVSVPFNLAEQVGAQPLWWVLSPFCPWNPKSKFYRMQNLLKRWGQTSAVKSTMAN